MAEITAALVMELRAKSGVGMMDCKKALQETDGDINAAIDWLRAKGLSKAAKKADRVAAEGLVAVASKEVGAGEVASAFMDYDAVPDAGVWKVMGDEVILVALPTSVTEAAAFASAFCRTVPAYESRQAHS